MENIMRLLLAGGGTGGHINPAIAVAEAMKRRHGDIEIAFVGREGGDENNAVTSRGFKLYTLRIRGLSRKLSADAVKSALLALRSLKGASEIINEFKPDAVIATGGYVSWPILKRSISAGIPTFLHESNIYPGLVTRMLGEKCDLLLLNSAESLKYLKKVKNYKVVGNPLREDFFKQTKRDARGTLGISGDCTFIVSFGGSLGSERLNEVIAEVMNGYTEDMNIRHLHACGTRYFEKIKESDPRLTCGGKCKIVPYINNMPTALTAADIVISRSGAMTLSEIAKAGAAAILIPSPNVADDHQRKNAQTLANADAALMIPESELTADALGKRIREIISDRNLKTALSTNVKGFYVPDSAVKISEQIESAVANAKNSADE